MLVMHPPPRWPPETLLALGSKVGSPGRIISKNSVTSLPRRSRRGSGTCRSRPIMPPRHLLGPLSQQRAPRRYERSPRQRRSPLPGALLPGDVSCQCAPRRGHLQRRRRTLLVKLTAIRAPRGCCLGGWSKRRGRAARPAVQRSGDRIPKYGRDAGRAPGLGPVSLQGARGR